MNQDCCRHLEQRFGRLHRTGQTEVCHLWNLVATETREGEVYLRLLKKLDEERKALQGRVFDVLGKLKFADRSLAEFAEGDVFSTGIADERGSYVTGAGCVVRYVRQPFSREPDFSATCVNYDWDALWARGEEPA